ncbi:NAD-dependent epimerase/dehydratase family protein [Micromonospora echinospora]
MRTLVVGGTGTVGPGVVRGLVDAGHDVVVAHRGETVADLPVGVSVARVDRHLDGALAELVSTVRPDAVVDLTCDDGDDGRLTVAACRGVDRLLVVSSVNAAGGPLPTPVHERVTPAPVSDYGRDKLGLEQAVRDSWTTGDSRALVVRLGPVYRPGSGLDGQLAEDTYWLGQALAGEPAVLADEGERYWNLLHAEDAGRAFAALLANPAAERELVLVASRRPIRWRDLYRTVHSGLGLSTRTVSAPAQWLVEQLDDDEWLQETSLWDQVYDLSLLDRLAPDYQEHAGDKELVATAAWLVDQGETGDPELIAEISGLGRAWAARDGSPTDA